MGRPDFASDKRRMLWSFAKKGDVVLNGSINNDIGTLRWIDTFRRENLIAVGDNGTLLLSHDDGKTWDLQGGTVRPNLLYVQTTNPSTATFTGADGYIGDLTISPTGQLISLSEESTPVKDVKDAVIYQISSRSQKDQWQLAQKMLRLLNVSSLLHVLTNSIKAEDFRNRLTTSRSEVEYTEGLPTNSDEYSKVKSWITTFAEIKERVDADVSQEAKIDDDKTKALSVNPVTTSEFMIWITGARAMVAAVAFFAIIFRPAYRYHSNQAAYYEGRDTQILRLARFAWGVSPRIGHWFKPGANSSDNVALNLVGDVVGGIKDTIKRSV